MRTIFVYGFLVILIALTNEPVVKDLDYLALVIGLFALALMGDITNEIKTNR